MTYLFFFCLAKVHYFRAFQNQNIILRRPPIPSFDDALGEAFKISSMRHDKYGQMEPDYLNSLMYLALDKIPFLPFALTLEKWRWSIYDGKTFVSTVIHGGLCKLPFFYRRT